MVNETSTTDVIVSQTTPQEVSDAGWRAEMDRIRKRHDAYEDKAKAIIAALLIGCQDWSSDEDNQMHDAIIQPYIDGARFIGVDFSFHADRTELKQLIRRVQEGGKA